MHHVTPVHERGGEYAVSPADDLLPVCPNCHLIIHSRLPAYTIPEVRAMLERPTDA